MPRQKSSTPEYKYHTSGQARVYLDGRYFYLGEHGSKTDLSGQRVYQEMGAAQLK